MHGRMGFLFRGGAPMLQCIAAHCYMLLFAWYSFFASWLMGPMHAYVYVYTMHAFVNVVGSSDRVVQFRLQFRLVRT